MGELELLPVTPTTLLRSAGWFLAFFWALFLGSIVLPGFRHRGFPQPDGARKDYKLSGFVLFGSTHVVIGLGVAFLGWRLTPLLTHFWSLFIVVNAWAFLFLAYLFVRGRRREKAIERDSKLPAFLHDLWFGIELNPTLFGVDLKMFFYHPSLIGLAVMNASFAFAQWELYGVLTPEMVLYQAFAWSYLFTHYLKEHFMLSTWDILAERFGFMLVWGDLVYVPFLYSMVGWWVLPRGWEETHGEWVHDAWPTAAYVALAAFHLLSHWIFRSSNWQKDRFKRDPNVTIWGKKAETLGGKLLVSGWWGVGRKINYTGEIGVYISFALCAGFSSPWPYVLPLTLIILLTQRAGRDDKRCREKYGELWERYCERARFRIFPFVY